MIAFSGFVDSALEDFLEVGAVVVGFVILLELGPKERGVWVRVVGFEGLRRVGGIVVTAVKRWSGG